MSPPGLYCWMNRDRFERAFESGLGAKFTPLLERWKQGKPCDCACKALNVSQACTIRDRSQCGDCPLASSCPEGGTVAVKLEWQDTVYGMMAILLQPNCAADEEELNLLEELAGDLAFALHGLRLAGCNDKRPKTPCDWSSRGWRRCCD